MAYSKTQWVDNTTPIDKDNLNKIEQGIYDNSLVADAVTNTLNPTDTETYKTAELTEGQITDVIGVSDIVIKGDTEQDGTPTPSAPVDVNVVSGSNVINTSNKNLLKLTNYSTQTINGINLTFKNGAIICNGTATANVIVNLLESDLTLQQGTYALSGCPSGGGVSSNYKLDIFKVSTSAQLAYDIGNGTTFTLSEQTTFDRVRLVIFSGKTVNNLIFKPQLEISSTATTYEPHQGKELPLDLPVENLLDISKLSLISNNNYLSSGTNKILVKPNTTYTFKVKESTGTDGSIKLYDSNNNNTSNYSQTSSSRNLITFTTGANDSYLIIQKWYIGVQGITNVSEVEPQLEKGSKANAYTPYGTEPIELCKIGNYQDYFYKSGSKWYLHKETEKKVLDGTESWNRSSNGAFYPANNLLLNIILPSNSSSLPLILSNKFIASTYTDVWDNNKDFGIALASNGSNNPRIRNNSIDNVNDFKSWLANNLPSIYCAKSTPTDTEITDTTLISQLETIYNAPLYEQTNITQTNNDLPMVLDITACKDNINGIKAFIRK